VRIASIVGTRPQLIKVAAISPVLRARHEEILVDTGQHYDESMAGRFFAELDLPRPDVELGIGGGTQAEQTGRLLPAIEAVIERERPDAVLIFGDTNSTLAGALAAAKLTIPIGHVEAGLRSFDRRMPEEINRIVADHLSRWLFAPTPTAVANLAAEGLGHGALLVGDLMQDLAARVAGEVRDPAVLEVIGPLLRGAPGDPGTDGRPVFELRPGGYILATIHRAENRAPAAIEAWAGILGAMGQPDRPVILALHPGTGRALAAAGVALPANVHVVEPQGYRTTLALQLHAAAVVTDSGGIQRESAWLRVPCLVLRSTTEWAEAVDGSGGRMVVVGLDQARAVRELARLAPRGSSEALARDRAATLDLEPAGAGEAIVRALG
jgi:UDP-N-acetylglucosamine 2-epimerase